MSLIITMSLGLACGYLFAILAYLLLSLAITSSAPHFVSHSGHFRNRYLLTNYFGWTLSTMIGSYITATVSAAWFPWLPVFSLAVLVFLAAWFHPLEAQKQLAGLSRILMSVLGVVGVILGFYLKLKK